MSGHNKWSKIKRQKGATDAQKSKVFSKYSKFITTESKKTKGDTNSPGLAFIIDKAKKENMPKDAIDRAVKKGLGNEAGSMEAITYEAYGPGGCAMVIEALTDNRNKAAQEIKHILSKNGFALAGIGAATWAFQKQNMEWVPQTTTPLEDSDIAILETLLNELEDNDEVQEVYTNAE